MYVRVHMHDTAEAINVKDIRDLWIASNLQSIYPTYAQLRTHAYSYSVITYIYMYLLTTCISLVMPPPVA